MSTCINCGQRTVQGNYRIALGDICKNNEIEKGDVIEIFARKVEKNDR